MFNKVILIGRLGQNAEAKTAQNNRHYVVLRYREVEDEVKGTNFKHRIAEIHAISMKRLSKIEAADDPSDGADDE
jgi:single-strand DNA-binding protein